MWFGLSGKSDEGKGKGKNKKKREKRCKIRDLKLYW